MAGAGAGLARAARRGFVLAGRSAMGFDFAGRFPGSAFARRFVARRAGFFIRR